MCGIFGAFRYRGKPLADIEDKLKKSASLLHHRGPDDRGYYISGDFNAGLAHTRLSIIDLDTGHQPVTNEDSSVWIVFNGEIFNYRSLRHELVQKGHVFKTNSDTEVIVHLYEEYGTGCLDYLRGMFAFAVWDEKKNQLFCARDRLGQKPFVYTISNGNFYFSSEILPLVQLTSVSRDIDPTALVQYFHFFLPAAPHSIFKEIKKLRPGYALLIDNSGLKEYPYWNLNYLPKFKNDEKELTDRLESLVDEAVRIRLISEVPLGSMLSGGLDSSIVSFFAQKNSSKQLKTFGAFHTDETSRDLDWSYVKQAADAIGSEHHHIFYDESGMLDKVPAMVASYGEPYASINGPVSAILSEKIREHVTVALSGNGGDEVFGGYNTYLKAAFLNNPIFRAVLKIPSEKRMKRFAKQWSGENLEKSFAKWMRFYPFVLPGNKRAGYVGAPFSKWLGANLFSEDFIREAQPPEQLFQELFESARTDHSLDSWMYTDLMGRMQENMVVRSDITGMMASLEIRAPLLDHKLVEFAARLPVSLKVNRFKTTKYLLSQVALRHLPPSLINRKKQGFSGVTYSRLISCAQGPWKNRLQGYLMDDSKLSQTGFFKKEGIEKIWKGLLNSSADSDTGTRYFLWVWALVVLEIWYETVYGASS